MKTGLESLDTGAPEITYSGNQGPKSPQEDQQKMAEFQMAQLEEEYAKYVFEMEEQGLEPMSMQQFMEQAIAEARQDVKDGGVMQLVKENEDGSRPGYRGPGGYQGGSGAPGSAESSSGTTGGTTGGGNGNNLRGPAELGATTRTVNPVTSEAPYEMAGGQKFAVGDPKIAEVKNVVEQPKSLNVLDLYKKYSPIPNFFKMFGPLDNKEFFIEKVLTSKNPQGYDEDDYEDYMAARMAGTIDAYGNPIGGNIGNTNDQQIDLSTQIAMAPITTDIDTDTTGATTDTTNFVNRFAPVTSLPFADYKGGIEVAADGGRIGYADGGITDLRQGYFLGKLVKKATRAVKKIAKSPIGKAALLGLGAYGLGGGSFFGKTLPGLGQRSFIGGKSIFNMKNILPNLIKYGVGSVTKGGGTTQGLLGAGGKLSPFRTIGLTSLLPFLTPQEQEDENLDAIIGQTARGPSVEDIFGMNLNQIAKGARENTLDPNVFNFLQSAADGGRIGYDMGGIAGLRSAALNEIYGINDDENEIKKLALGGSAGLPPVTMQTEGMDSMSFPDDESTGMAQATPTATLPNQMPMRQPMMNPMMQRQMMAQRGNPMMARGMMQQPRIMAQEGGMMDMGGMEKDYRNEGGFVPIGGQERADDVPARLSKNEFVFTADAVRNAGGGDIDKGAEIMENMMENLEAGGKVSEASQGLKGAREMFATQQRLGEVL